ncbi:HAD family hydrolase [Glycomyces sp. NPDC048151]|uniref:HAD family hydrolase n=1 Tax=Glycomyces sp. NPDC048151 TaxID=3364002 RepID=UPI0037132D81
MSSLHDRAADFLRPAEPTGPVPPVEAVLFDFSNTIFRLIDLEEWLRRFAEAADRTDRLEALGSEAIARDLTETYRLPEVQAAQKGRDLSAERHRAAIYAWWKEVDFIRGAEDTAYANLQAPGSWVPFPDTEPVLRALHAKGIKVGIVSDFAWDPRVHLACLGLDGLVGACVVSFEHGREKPDPELFRLACEALGADPAATLMVGDNAARDGGAAAIGARAYILPARPGTGERGLVHVLDFLP